jgi:hypothetical protein
MARTPITINYKYSEYSRQAASLQHKERTAQLIQPYQLRGSYLAEKEGFEPSRPLWGLHDFQSCALDQTTRLLHSFARFQSALIV